MPGTSQPDSWRRDLRPRVYGAVFFFALLLLVALMVAVLASPALTSVDARISEAIRALRTPALTEVAKVVTSIADSRTMLVLVPATSLLLWFLGRRSGAIVLAVTVGGGYLIGRIIQELLHRARPAGVALIPLPEQYSFPSGHALAATLYFGTLGFIVLGEVKNPPLRYALVTVFWFLAFAISMSRVYLGVHYFADVVAAWLLGCAVVIVAILGYFAFSRPSEQ